MPGTAKTVKRAGAGFSAASLDDPLEYIARDHFRQRQVCTDLRRFAGAGRVSFADAQAVIAFLEKDLPLHHQDEEIDLFPRLRRRTEHETETGIDEVIARLNADHDQAKPNVATILSLLRAATREQMRDITPDEAQLLIEYAASEHRHLAVENAIILTIARRALTRRDRMRISRAMKRRRGFVV